MIQKLKIAMIVFAGIEPLDHYGSYRGLSRLEAKGKIRLEILRKTTEKIEIGHRTIIIPDASYTDNSKIYDCILIPGGPGQTDVMNDDDLKKFIQNHDAQRKYIASVCTGALLLGNAGILKDKKATTYWKAAEALSFYGANVAVHERIVHDGHIITSGGVTSGIDLSHYLIDLLFGKAEAEEEILNAQYDPAPLYPCGVPSLAAPTLVKKALETSAPLNEKRMKQARGESNVNETGSAIDLSYLTEK